jgi:hypothetical protein
MVHQSLTFKISSAWNTLQSREYTVQNGYSIIKTQQSIAMAS